MDLGKVVPNYYEGQPARIWNCPIAVFEASTGTEFDVVTVYSDEGYLCIDVKIKDEDLITVVSDEP